MKSDIDISFALLKSALDGTIPEVEPLEATRWWKLFRLMQQNHVAAMTADTVAGLPQNARPPREVLIPWLSEREKVAARYRHQREVQDDIVARMHKAGIETLVLKGTHLAERYPVPELREFGDLDLYFFDRHDKADKVAQNDMGVDISHDAHHHTRYDYRGITIESHYDFLNIHYPPTNRRYEAMLKELVGTDKQLSTFNFQPSTFEVLFLLRHMACHFAANRLTLRDVVDWYLTCRQLNDTADWSQVCRTAKEYGMAPFAATLNAIVERRFSYRIPMDYGMATRIDEFESDTLYGSAETIEHPYEDLGRLLWKLRRYRANRWKKRMAYRDSAASLLLSSLTSHALRPRSIIHKM